MRRIKGDRPFGQHFIPGTVILLQVVDGDDAVFRAEYPQKHFGKGMGPLFAEFSFQGQDESNPFILIYPAPWILRIDQSGVIVMGMGQKQIFDITDFHVVSLQFPGETVPFVVIPGIDEQIAIVDGDQVISGEFQIQHLVFRFGVGFLAAAEKHEDHGADNEKPEQFHFPFSPKPGDFDKDSSATV